MLIVQFLSFEDPLKVLVSDTLTSIQATVASEAANAFTTKQRRRLSEGTQGGIFQLLRFEIVATHLGAASENVTLLIQEFKHIGSDGSRCFGSPHSILNQDGIQRFVEELKAFRTTEVASSRSDRVVSPSYSFESVEVEDDESEIGYYNEGRMNFATQGPMGKKTKSLLEPFSDADKHCSIRLSNGENSYNETASDEPSQLQREGHERSVHSLVKEQQGGSEQLEIGVSSNTTLPAPKTSAKTLLALLSNKPSTNDARSQPTISSEVLTLLKPAVPLKDAVLSTRPNPKNMYAMDVDAIINDAVTEAHSALHSVTETSSSTDQGNLVHDSTTSAKNHRVLTPPSLEVGALQTISDARKTVQDTHGIAQLDLNTVGSIGAEEVEFVEDPWKDVTRIRRRDILILKSQQCLLERKDCWIPPESGVRTPTANLPVPILQSFTATINGHIPQQGYDDRIKSRAVNSPIRRQTGSASPANVSRYASDSKDLQEIPFSSGEWPPSSPPTPLKRDQLPPDSSFSVPSPEASSPQFEHETPSMEVISSWTSREPVAAGTDSEPSTFHGILEELDNDAHQNEDADSGNREVTQKSAPSTKQALDSESHISLRKLSNDHDVVVTNMQSAEDCQEQEATHSKLPLSAKPDYLSFHQTRSNYSILPTTNAGDVRLNGMVIDVDSDTATADSSQSEMETTIPGALQSYGTHSNVQQPRQTPPRHSHRHYPTLQVDRTPCTVQCQRNKQLAAGQRRLVSVNSLPNEDDDEDMPLSSVENAFPAQIMVPGTFSPTHYMEPPVECAARAFKTSEGGIGVSQKENITAQAPKDCQNTVKQEILGRGARHQQSNKREAKETADTFSIVTKRRKRQMCLSGSASEGEEVREDPSMKARQHRREFLNALRSLPHIAAAPSTPLQSDADTKLYEDPKMPLSGQFRNDESGEHIQNEALSELSLIGIHTLDQPTSAAKALSPDRRPVLSSHIHTQKRDDFCPQSPDVLAIHFRKSELPSLFHRFQHVYPLYKGSTNHFVSMCRRIHTLEKDNRMEHKSLWDDFVIRHQIEYREYLLRCTEEAEDPIPYEMFYRKEIDEPKFTQRVLTPDNIAKAFLVESDTQVQSPVHSRIPVKTTIDFTQDEDSNVEALHNLSSRGVALSELANFQPQEPSSVELVAEAPPDINHYRSIRKTPRSLPWSETNISAPISASVRDKVLKATIKASAKDSTATPTKNRTRVRASPEVQAAATSTSATTPSEPILVARTLPSGSKYIAVQPGQKSSNILNNKTHGVVEASGLAPTSSAPIAKKPKGKVSLTSPARNAGRNKIKPALPSMSGSKPWYLDPVNPFKSFARAEASIKPGKGNGFVEDPHRRAIAGRPLVVENGVVIAPKIRIDVLGWHV